MVKYYCDMCGNEQKENEPRYGLSMINIDKDSPAMSSLELCPFCKVKVEKQIERWRVE